MSAEPAMIDAPRPCRRSVTFSDSLVTRIHDIPAPRNFHKEIRARWLSKVELDHIKNDVKKAVMMIEENPILPDSDNYSRRGVQQRTKSGFRRQRAIRSLALETVLREQKAQREEEGTETTDPELIAIWYKDVCMTSEQDAYTRGISDAKAAQQLQEELVPGTTSSTTSRASREDYRQGNHKNNKMEKRRVALAARPLRYYMKNPRKIFSSSAA